VTQISEGLSRLAQDNFQIILLDLSLLDGFGLSMVNQVCTTYPQFPVIILTSHDDETMAIQAVQEGAQDYLVKGQMDGNLLIRAIQYAIERKRIEEKLRESEEIFRQLAENIREVFYICEHDIRQPLYISPAYEEIWGRPCKSFYKDPRSFWDAIHPDDKDRVMGSLFRRSEKEVMEIYCISRPDGSIRWIKERSFPIHDRSGKLYLIVGIATDITDQKLREEQLKSLGFHDPLTGLYNRAYFEEEMSRIEKARYDSVGMVSCDVDGLKLVNDTFGHAYGDNLLLAAARVIREVFREADVVARIGGDEFSAILPNTTKPIIQDICRRIEEAVANYSTSHPNLPLSISVGFAFTHGVPPSLRDLFKEADNNMYRRKLHHAQKVHHSIVQALMNTLKARDLITQQHVDRLEKWLVRLAVVLGIPESTLPPLRLLTKFHDIGKIGVPDHILFKEESLNPEEWTEMQRHCEIGYRIALSTSQLVPIADWILKHHEWWDGGGYPLGLRGEEIPIECRMLTVTEAYEALTSERPYRRAFSSEEAVVELRSRSGTQFDPEILDKFIHMLKGHSPDMETESCERRSFPA
jgi:diguanylate cyclase (GGDEF)-like protein/PAS domain S-box-containing protein